MRERPASSLIAGVEPVSDTGDMMPDSALRLELKTALSESELREHITLTPQNEFVLRRENDKTYILESSSLYDEGSLVKLSVTEDDGFTDSWAFQTWEPFGITEVYPADGADSIYINSGIEITFSSDIDNSADMAEYFIVDPPVQGKFTVRFDKLYFMPSDMQTDTLYTVTVKAGLPGLSGEALSEGFSFSFRTAYDADGTYMFTRGSNSGFSEAFIPGDQAVVQIYESESLRQRPHELHLYSFGSSAAYRETLEKRSALIGDPHTFVNTDGMREVFTSAEVPFMRDYYDGYVYVLLPEGLEEGYYLAEVTIPGTKFSVQYMVQITPLAVYGMGLEGEDMFFVNDSLTGKAVSGAKVTLSSGDISVTGITGADGLLTLDTSELSRRAILEITSGSASYTDSYSRYSYETPVYDELYYSYIFTDREAYLPTDTINVWGLLIPKTRGTPLSEGLHLTLSDAEKQDITVGKDGTFSASFTYRNRSSYGLRLALQDKDDRTIVSKYVLVMGYEKPTYQFDLDVPRYALFPQTESFPVTVSASYFEGTPAGGLMFRDYGDNVSDRKELVTDSTGSFTAKVKSKDDNNSWKADSFCISYMLTGVENTYSNVVKLMPAYYRDTMLTHSFDETSHIVTLNANLIDFSKIDEFCDHLEDKYDNFSGSGFIYPYDEDYDFIRGEAADIPLHITVDRHYYEKTEDSSYYDYVEKRTVYKYNYKYMTERVAETDRTAVNGVCVLDDIPLDKDCTYYEVTVYYKDSLGQSTEENFSIYPEDRGSRYMTVGDEISGAWFYTADSRELAFSLQPVKEGRRRSGEYSSSFTSFSENETLAFQLECSSPDVDTTQGRLLFAAYRSGFVSASVSELNGSDIISYNATADVIPDARFSGAYFDGRHIYRVYGSHIYYDPGERELTLTANSDRETYDAGDTATLTVRAADSGGKPVSGIPVLLSLVDEAAFAIENQKADILGDIYRFTYYPPAEEYGSYIQHAERSASGGEKGGGAAEPVAGISRTQHTSAQP